MALSQAISILPGISSLQFRALRETLLSSLEGWYNPMEVWRATTVVWEQIRSVALKLVALAPGEFQGSQA